MLDDIKEFNLNCVIDSCSVINIVSSETLFSNSKREKCKFVITTYIEYELLKKNRTNRNTIEEQRIQELNVKIEHAIQNNEISKHSIELSDLLDPLVVEHKNKNSKGELTAILLAKRYNIGFFTDDTKAQRLARTSLGADKVESLCTYVGWLTYKCLLNDSDIDLILRQQGHFYRNVSMHVKNGFEKGLTNRLL